MIEIREIYTPALKLKGIYKSGTRSCATLEDLRPLPAKIILPIEMLRIHLPNRPKLLLHAPKKALELQTTPESTNTRKDDLLSFFEECVDDDKDEDDENNILDEANLNVTSEKDIALVEHCLKLGMKGGISLPGREGTLSDERLGSMPAKIKNKYSSILGSGFHAGHCVITPTKHAFKKAFHVALSEAMYAWDEDGMRLLYLAMKNIFNME